METIAQEAKRLFDEIPEEKWMTGWFRDKNGRCCAIGHWNVLHGCDPVGFNNETKNLTETVVKYAANTGNPFTIDEVNDGGVQSYQQTTPKQRVLTLLAEMIEAGY